jgi:hypothetical protein
MGPRQMPVEINSYVADKRRPGENSVLRIRLPGSKTIWHFCQMLRTEF